MMGLIDSSYNKFRAVIFNRRVALGDMLILKNTFVWEKVVVNLPVKTTYDYQLP